MKPDPASDLYAVGATFYELLTGKAPPDAIKRTKGARLPSPGRQGAEVSPATVSALSRTLALAQEKRPASAHALLGLLPESELIAPNQGKPWEELAPWLGHRQPIRSLQMTSDGKFLASADRSGQLRLWSTEQERCLGVIEFDLEVADMAIHPWAETVIDRLSRHVGKDWPDIRQWLAHVAERPAVGRGYQVPAV